MPSPKVTNHNHPSGPPKTGGRGVAMVQWLAAVLLAVSVAKFGNPVILEVNEDSWDIWKLLFFSWPVEWGIVTSGAFLILGLSLFGKWKPRIRDPLFLLVSGWLVWQFASAVQTDDTGLTWRTLPHLAVCLGWFHLGYVVLSGCRSIKPVWIGMFCGSLVVLAFSVEQHFHGIRQSRQFFYRQLKWRQYSPEFLKHLTSKTIPDSLVNQVRESSKPPAEFLRLVADKPLPEEIWQRIAEDHGMPGEFMKKINSNRIWGTMVYPNTLAGVLLLLTPFLSVFLWKNAQGFTLGARFLLVAIYMGTALACLIWSGSKSGWLIALAMGGAAFLTVPLDRRIRLSVGGLVLILGVAVFFARYGDFFHKGATSVGARLGYWESAIHTARNQPFFGSGPGTFSRTYADYKQDDWEMARLTHNDYLEQASDSGWPGFALFCTFFLLAFHRIFRCRKLFEDPFLVALVLSVSGWAIHSLVEFGLYIPALAWPAYFIFGWISGRAREYNLEAQRQKPPPDLQKS